MRGRLRAGVLAGVILGSLLAGTVEAQGPFSAQIQRALNALLAGSYSFTGPIKLADGTAAAPSLSFGSQVALGLYKVATGVIGFTDALGSVGGEWITGSGFSISSTRGYNWGSGGDPSVIDTQLLRPAAGVVSATSGFRAAFYTSPASSVLTVSSNTIAPTNAVHHVGAGLIKTITVPAACANTCSVDLVPDAAYTYDATGNVVVPAGGGTAVINKTMRMSWDGTKWNPSY